MFQREAVEGQDVNLGFLQHGDQLGEAPLEEARDAGDRLAGTLPVGLGKMVRSVAATICWAAWGTVDSALRMKCTRQRLLNAAPAGYTY